MAKLEEELKKHFPKAKEINIYPYQVLDVVDEDGDVLAVLEPVEGDDYQIRVDGVYTDTVNGEL